MARRKSLPELERWKLALAERLGSLRLDMFGERGGPEMARRLGIPVRTWYNYEGGVEVPCDVILKVIELTSVEPTWLLRGEGPKIRSHHPDNAPLTVEALPQAVELLRKALLLLDPTNEDARAGGKGAGVD